MKAHVASWTLNSLVLFAAFLAAGSLGQGLQGRCVDDSQCALNAACVTVDTGRAAFSKCTANKPICGGRTFGHCPSQDSEIGNMMCVFVETKKIRNVECCPASGTQLLPEGSPVDGVATVSPSATTAASAAATTSSPITTKSAARELLVESAVSCFDCYKPPGSNRTIPGSFQCVLKDQCKAQSVFPKVCDTGLSCDTAKNELCSRHGTCAPIDLDAPQGTYRCMCDVGFGGRFCDQVISNECVADCGVGGICVDGQCVCKKGYIGDQCFGCTHDAACNADKLSGTCNLKTNTCDCVPGFQGDRWCGTTSDASVAVVDMCTLPTGPNCGDLGICLQSECYCRDGACVGSLCTKCTLPGCVDCVKSAAIASPLSTLIASCLASYLLIVL
ncbi:hypothetical protein H310_04566 [Aphanomyces invadans]|uniref:EGF-like domain-containing protein n=1 Tax=Aphanomyces invadans TaxID=157072 RepID=A0A024UD86_9STRA|nr:hypothetical protein H310_04566 [Aphanomyces invadans]ETW04229.1 hypothetical protein H310_04566 [Aphanomyces invadans]|eukprot:XP_008867185.1 hypothetical protein H310_04566 [Aphanomyces invadans]